MDFSKSLTDFSLRICSEIIKTEEKDKNICPSPASIYLVMAMVHLGTEGSTRQQLTDLLGVDYGAVFDDQASEASKIKDVLDKCRKSSEINNKIFTSSEMNKKYIDLLYALFATEYQAMSFQSPKKACEIMNSWVNQKTHGRITEIFNESIISQSTIFTLVNTIYFKSSWQKKFDQEDTSDQNFYKTPDDVIKVRMMYRSKKVRYYKNDTKKFTSIALDFATPQQTALFILPHSGYSVEDLVSNLKTEDINSCFQESKRQKVDIEIPKFKVSSNLSLTGLIAALGATDIFSLSTCNAPNISSWGFFVSSIIQSANVEIDEEGVVAAAATGMVCDGVCSEPKLSFIANRPFVMLIYDENIGAPIFFVVIQNPKI